MTSPNNVVGMPLSLDSNLEVIGFDVLETEPSVEAFLEASRDIGRVVGASDFGYTILESTGSSEQLPVHAENISHENPGLPGYFALGCITEAALGGETTIYDARTAAATIQTLVPELADVRVGYTALAYPEQISVHSLVYNSLAYGPVLRFRERVITNTLMSKLPEGMSEDDFYDVVKDALIESLIATHSWKPGELLVVNNGVTLHGRQPFEGKRKLIRIRFDDPNHREIQVA